MESTHILACLSSSPSNEKIITNAASMAKALHCSFSALFVETSSYNKMDAHSKNQLQHNINLAKSLGAKVETVVGDDIPYQIAEFARLNNITTLVIGRNSAPGKFLSFSSGNITDKVIALAPNLDIHIIPDAFQTSEMNLRNHGSKDIKALGFDIIKSILVLFIATMIGTFFDLTKFSEANIIILYNLAVLVIAVITEFQITSLIVSVFSVFVYNFFFTIPRYTLLVYDPGAIVTFVVMFASAFMTSSLALRLKENAKNSSQVAYRTKILFDTSQLLEKAREKKEILETTAMQLEKLLHRTVILFPVENQKLDTPLFYFPENKSESFALTDEDIDAVNYTLHHHKQSGATTDVFSSLGNYYLSLSLSDSIYGVVGISIENEPLEYFEQSILLSILSECAMALENEQNRRIFEEEALKAQKEELRANLLRSISHDLRTPLTSISGNAYNLLSTELSEETKSQTLNDIYDDSMWLITLVENLLAVTRIEDESLQLHYSTELLSDIIDEALNHVSRKKSEHHFIREEDEYILVNVDTRLIVQVFINLIDNAIKHTPVDSIISVKTQKKNDKAIVQIIDNGPGIAEEEKKKVFEMFYTTSNKIVDSRRSMGMGLPLCKLILQSHGQYIEIKDNEPNGCIFEFTLPIKEVEIRE